MHLNQRIKLVFVGAALALASCSASGAGSGVSPGSDASGSAGDGAGSAGVAGSGSGAAGAAGVGAAGFGGNATSGDGGGSGKGGQAGAAGGASSVGGTSGASGGAGQAGASAGGGQGGAAGGAGQGGASGNAGQAGMSGNAGQGGSAGLGQGGSAGTAGGAGYQPCPSNGNPCKVLPLGDSITWGIQYDGAYRVELFTKAVAAGKKLTFTGSLSNGPTTVAGQAFPKSNEGHSGWTIDQIAGLIPNPALNTPPNIILLMIGTNDVYAPSGQAMMPNRLGSLLDKIIAAAPNALLVVAKITPLANTGWNATVNTYNAAIPAVVQSRIAAGKHVMLADMNTGFTQAMLSNDGIHPQKSGYDFMGDSWYQTISAVLP